MKTLVKAQAILLAIAVSLAIAIPAYADTSLGFYNITDNNAGDAAIGEAQLSVDVSNPGPGQVLFTFHNIGPEACSITDVYFDDGSLLGIAEIIDGTGVNFELDAAPPDLPGGESIPIPFDVTEGFSADSEPPAQPNGVNPGEWLGIRFDLQAGRTFEDVLADLTSGALRIGIHVQGFASGGSEAFINEPPEEEPEYGILQVTKTVNWNGVTPHPSKTFEICITGPSYSTPNCKNAGYNGAVLTWADLIPGAYTVTEADQGAEWTVVVSGSPATVSAGSTATASVSNTRRLGSLEVTKTVNWNGVTPDPSKTFEICITGPSYSTPNCKNAGYNGGTLTWTGLVPGLYSVTETDPGAEWTVVVSGSPATVPTNGGTAYASVTNTREKPTAVELASFTAEANGNEVTLAWETAAEIDNAGFNLYRATAPEGPYAQINGELIAAQGGPASGFAYRFVDQGLASGTYYYTLEDVDYNGAATLHGPLSATVAPQVRRPSYRPIGPQ